MHAGEADHTWPGWTWTGLSVEESVRMTEDRDKWRKDVHGVANPRMAKEQNWYLWEICSGQTDELHEFARGGRRQNAVALQSIGTAARRHHDHPQTEVRQQREDRVLHAR